MKKRNKLRITGGIAAAVVFAVAIGYIYKTNIKVGSKYGSNANYIHDNNSPAVTTENIDEKEEKKTVTICSLGNMMFHDKQLVGAQTEDGYDFTDSFQYIKDMVSSADIGIGIFEGTVAGGTPAGFPYFNSPDSSIDAFKDAGIDILNIASNHIYDKSDEGLLRTVNITKEKGMEPLGVRSSLSDKRYVVKDIDGVKIGFIAYVFETPNSKGQRTINSNVISDSSAEFINTFDYENINAFYSDIEGQIDVMKADGAQFIVTSMHWGEEYDTKENHHQSDIAERLNKLGVDIILGGHPHVIQPYETIVGESGHETFVIYSQGNSLSNQCDEEIGIPESEDGIIINFTLEADDSGVKIARTEIVPTWVYRELKDDGTYYHKIIPINDAIENKNAYNLSDEAYERAKGSLQRTINIVGSELIDGSN